MLPTFYIFVAPLGTQLIVKWGFYKGWLRGRVLKGSGKGFIMNPRLFANEIFSYQIFFDNIIFLDHDFYLTKFSFFFYQFFLTFYGHLENIKNFGPKYFGPTIFWEQHNSGQRLFGSKIIWVKKLFGNPAGLIWKSFKLITLAWSLV